MGAVVRIYEQTGNRMKKVAEVRGGKVSGKKAASIRKILRQYGFPSVPIEDIIDHVLMTHPGIGVAVVGPMDRNAEE